MFCGALKFLVNQRQGGGEGLMPLAGFLIRGEIFSGKTNGRILSGKFKNSTI
jgi:hypothetical protein